MLRPGSLRNRTIAWHTIIAEFLWLLLTVVCSSILVVLLIFAPRVFVGWLAEPPLGWNGYLSTVYEYLIGLLSGRLTEPERNARAWKDVLTAAHHSLVLLAISLVAALLLGIAWGGLLATVRQSILRVVLFGLNTLLMSLPSFAVMLLLMETIATYTVRTGVQLTYVQGYGLDRHLLLPVTVLALRGAAFAGRALQIAQEEIVQQDWIRGARAKGLGGLRLWWHHVLPALYLPMIGILLGTVRVIISGLVIVDYLYNWGGLGSYLLVPKQDVAGVTMNPQTIGAALVLVLFFVSIDGLSRLGLRAADPRILNGDT